MGRTVVEQPIERFFICGLFVRDIYFIDYEQIPLRPIESRCIGQVVFANHLRAIENFVLHSSLRIQVHDRNRVKRFGMTADELEGCLSLAATGLRDEKSAERMQGVQSTSVILRFVM